MKLNNPVDFEISQVDPSEYENMILELIAKSLDVSIKALTEEPSTSWRPGYSQLRTELLRLFLCRQDAKRREGSYFEMSLINTKINSICEILRREYGSFSCQDS